jgi:hypothetical protein
MCAVINYLAYGEILLGKEYIIPPIIVSLMGTVGDLMKLRLKKESSVSIAFMKTFIVCSITALLSMVIVYYTIIDNMYEFKTVFLCFTMSVILVSGFNAYEKWREGRKR